MARVFEAGVILAGLILVPYLVRQCRREHRITFDAQFAIAGLLTTWVDPTVNFLQPAYMYNSNWVNLRGWCDHIPLVPNPDCGRLPEPVLFIFPTYAFGFLAAGMLGCRFMQWLRRRWPTLSTGRFLALALLGFLFFDLILEVIMVSSHAWSYPGSPRILSVLGNTHRLHVPDLITAMIFFFTFAAVRYFKDDHGHTFIERHTRHLSRPLSSATAFLALVGLITSVALLNTLTVAVTGLYADPYPVLPRHLVNDLCDTPGVSGTAYGPCPGTPGYRIPIWDLAPANGSEPRPGGDPRP